MSMKIPQHTVIRAFVQGVVSGLKSTDGRIRISSNGRTLFAGAVAIATKANDGSIAVIECVHPWVARKVHKLQHTIRATEMCARAPE